MMENSRIQSIRNFEGNKNKMLYSKVDLKRLELTMSF